MISKIKGKLVEKKDQSLLIEVSGLCYEVLVPQSVIDRIGPSVDKDGCVSLVTYYYLQMNQASGHPVLVGFLNEVERDFFLQFIKVSGIGPKAAVKALDRSIAQIAQAIDEGDMNALKDLPGIGAQRAKEIIAKLQGKVGRFGLIKDKVEKPSVKISADAWEQETLDVLLQLGYKKQEAEDMVQKALKRNASIKTAEDLLNEIYKQKVKV